MNTRILHANNEAEQHQASDLTWSHPHDLIQAENKQQITLRLDPDVLAFFRATGKRYQSRINAALREYMAAHLTAETTRTRVAAVLAESDTASSK